MREVIVTVGPRGSGKSTFCNSAVGIDPSINLVSRDEILIRLFGKVLVNPYSGGHAHALELMWKNVEELLESHASVRLVLDTWNGSTVDRRRIVRQLRELGADRVVAWYFTTPLRFVEEWFWKKPGIAKMEEMKTQRDKDLVFYQENAPRREYLLFHTKASRIDHDGLDEVTRINPVAVGPSQVLSSMPSYQPSLL